MARTANKNGKRDSRMPPSNSSGKDLQQDAKLKSFRVATAGIRTSDDFKEMMSAIMTELRRGELDTVLANAICNAGGKLLKCVQLEMDSAAQNRTIKLGRQ